MRIYLAIALLTSLAINNCAPPAPKMVSSSKVHTANVDNINLATSESCQKQGDSWYWDEGSKSCLQKYTRKDAKQSCEDQGTLWTWNSTANRCEQNTQFLVSESLCTERAKTDSTFAWNAVTKRCEEGTQYIRSEDFCREKSKTDTSYSWNSDSKRCEQNVTIISDEALCREKILKDPLFNTYSWNAASKRCEANINTITDHNLCNEKHKTDSTYLWNEANKRCEQTPTIETPVTGEDSCTQQPGGTDKWQWIEATGGNKTAYCQEIVPISTLRQDCITNQKAWITRNDKEICIPYTQVTSLVECNLATREKFPSLSDSESAAYWNPSLSNSSTTPPTFGRCFSDLAGEKVCLEKNLTATPAINQTDFLKAYNWTNGQCFKGLCPDGQVHIGWNGRTPICDTTGSVIGAVTLGERSGCALLANPAVSPPQPLQLKCWGNALNYNQGVVYASSVHSASLLPITIPVDTNHTADDPILGVAVGHGYACGIAGTNLYCWGRSGAIDNLAESTATDKTPTLMTFPSDVTNFYVRKVITQNNYENDNEMMSCAIVVPKAINKGKLYCWGRSDTAANTGNGIVVTNPANTFVDRQLISNLPQDGDVIDACVGALHACSIVEHKNNNDVLQSDVYCWGSAYASRLGDGTNADAKKPVTKITLPTGVSLSNGISSPSKLACGLNHTCVIANTTSGNTTTNGNVYCWGSGEGNMFFIPTPSPAPVIPPNQVSTPTLVQDATVSNTLATGVTLASLKLNTVSQIAAGTHFTCAVASKGATVTTGTPPTTTTSTYDKLYCWGYNTYGQLGIGNTTSSTSSTGITEVTSWGGVTSTAADTTISDLTSGNQSVCAVRKEPVGTTPQTYTKKLYCWGYNGYNSLMIANTANVTTPSKVYPSP